MRTKNKMFIIMIGLLLSSGIIINNNDSLNNYNNAFALEYSTNAGVNFTLKPSISVSLSSSDLHISELNPGTSSDSNIITINILSNNSTGYVVNSSVGDNSNNNNNRNLNHTNSSATTAKFASLDYGSSIGNMADSTVDDNTWGYSYDNGEGWSSYSGLPLYSDTTNIATLKTTNTPSTADGDNIAFKIAAKASHTQASGDYTNIINFIVVGNATPVSFYDAFTIAAESDPSIEQLNGYYKMQDMTDGICNNVHTSQLADNSDTMEAQLIDIRDNNIYWVAKLKDGKCWMTQNLDLNLSIDAPLTSENTDLSDHSLSGAYADGYEHNPATGVTTWRPAESTGIIGLIADGDTNDYAPHSADPGDKYYYVSGSESAAIYDSLLACTYAGHSASNCKHYHAGNYYNYTAAIASNSSSSVGLTQYDNATNSICPRGWTLPVGRNGENMDRTFGDLFLLYNVADSTTATEYTEGGFSAISSKPLYFSRGGYALGHTQALGQGTSAYYWSKTVTWSSGVAMSFNKDVVRPASYFYRRHGFSVRCIAR